MIKTKNIKIRFFAKLSVVVLFAILFGITIKTSSVDASTGKQTLFVSPISSYGSGSQLLDFPPGSRIISSPTGINCPGTCSYEFDSGTEVKISYTAGSGFGLRNIGYECQEYAGAQDWGNYDSMYRGPVCTYLINVPDGTSNTVDLSPIWVKDKHITNLTIEGSGTIRATYGGVTKDCTTPGCTITAPYNKRLTMQAVSQAGVRFDGWSTNSNTYICAKSGTGVCYSGAALSTDTVPALARFSGTPSSSPTPTTNAMPSRSETKPSTPVVKLIASDGSELKPADGEEKVSFKQNDPIVLSGTTVPNGIVKLYIFSEPQEATVTADDEGNWSYTIASIEPGDHRVEVEVTDPETNETSERAEVLAFSVAQADTLEDGGSILINPPEQEAEESGLPVVLVAVGATIGIGVIALLIVSKMHPVKYINHLFKH